MAVSTLIITENKFRQFFKIMRSQYHTRDLEILESRTLSHIYMINFKNNKHEIIKIYLHHLHLSKEMKNFKIKIENIAPDIFILIHCPSEIQL